MKRILIGAGLAVCIFAGGFFTGRTTSRQPDTKTALIQNIEKPKQKILQSPRGRSYSELTTWALDPIVIYRTLEDGVLTIRATDTHKEARVVDRIETKAPPRHTVGAFPVALFDGRVRTGAGFSYSYAHDRFSAFALCGAGRGFALVGGGVGCSF